MASQTVSSSLVNYARDNGNSNARTKSIKGITPHCFVGDWGYKRMTDYFSTSGKSNSVNYIVAEDGIGQCIPESRRAWTSSSKDNDMQMITIEIGCETKKPYAMTDTVLKRLMFLMADIGKRNGIDYWKYSTSKSTRVNHKNGCNITLHEDFANTDCPGSFLKGKLDYVAKCANVLMNDDYMLELKVGWKFYTNKTYATYNSSKDALSHKNPVGCYPAGTFYIYKISGNSVNITRKKGVPGAWIDPVRN